MRIPPTAQPTKRTDPTGGVTTPMPRLRISMMPNCTGSIPIPTMTGRKIGVVIMISGDISIKVPNINKIKLTMSRITKGFSEIASKVVDSNVGTSVTANSQPKAAAVPIIINTMAVVFTALMLALTKPAQSSDRYTSTATITV